MRVGQRARLVDDDITGIIVDFHIFDHRRLLIAVACDGAMHDGEKCTAVGWVDEDAIELID